jgi:hypothetical protein
MPSANRASTPVAVDAEMIEGRHAAPFFAGLPNDSCPCAHWGVATEGQLTFRWPDREETFVAGDAYYAAPGRLPLVTAGTSVVAFSPTKDLEMVMAVVEKNLAAAGASS